MRSLLRTVALTVRVALLAAAIHSGTLARAAARREAAQGSVAPHPIRARVQLGAILALSCVHGRFGMTAAVPRRCGASLSLPNISWVMTARKRECVTLRANQFNRSIRLHG